MIRVVCPLLKFQSVLISPDRFVYARIADIVVIWESDLNQIWCFVDFIHHSYVGFAVDNLLVSLDWEFYFINFQYNFFQCFSALSRITALLSTMK